MSSPTAMLESPEKISDSQKRFSDLYKTLSDVWQELGPLEKKIFGFKDKLDAGRISGSEAEYLKKGMPRLSLLYDNQEKVKIDIQELRKQMPPETVQDELKAISYTISNIKNDRAKVEDSTAEILAEYTKIYVKGKGNKQDEMSKIEKIMEERLRKLDEKKEGLIFVEQKLLEFKEGREAEKNSPISKLKLD